MKAFLCCAVFVAVLAFASAEECRSVSDCDHVTCPESNYQLECHYRQCTCTQVSSSSGCTTKADCSGDDCRFGWHCVDAKCRCGFGFGGGK
ncbi:serine protease inhibitor Cvsi-2-like [Mercenaria mercenaria]|uniref:serine protease inhibitor Cvsi-2-like n=1 Tax=Mercenaria mercenaria TaxID=6596 RepID=UPI00234F6403|nr:serine protease inhibitor Cvsi-2-like [Mercenaria mercenaria]XP_053405757.1 serine protease inhibitor Cvsi-2-like [Mercenaria mercenaria]